RPPWIGTLRWTGSSTRLPFTSTSSRVRNCFMRVSCWRHAAEVVRRLVLRIGLDLHALAGERKGEAKERQHGQAEDDPLGQHAPLAVDRPQISLPIATAVSTMRLENPHSLSYHERTATMVPSKTLVWSMWNTDERGPWLKSVEALGRYV